MDLYFFFPFGALPACRSTPPPNTRLAISFEVVWTNARCVNQHPSPRQLSWGTSDWQVIIPPEAFFPPFSQLCKFFLKYFHISYSLRNLTHADAVGWQTPLRGCFCNPHRSSATSQSSYFTPLLGSTPDRFLRPFKCGASYVALAEFDFHLFAPSVSKKATWFTHCDLGRSSCEVCGWNNGSRCSALLDSSAVKCKLIPNVSLYYLLT